MKIFEFFEFSSGELLEFFFLNICFLITFHVICLCVYVGDGSLHTFTHTCTSKYKTTFFLDPRFFFFFVQLQLPPDNTQISVPSKMEEELKCTICIRFFEDPIILTCGHSLCRMCALKAHQPSTSSGSSSTSSPRPSTPGILSQILSSASSPISPQSAGSSSGEYWWFFCFLLVNSLTPYVIGLMVLSNPISAPRCRQKGRIE